MADPRLFGGEIARVELLCRRHDERNALGPLVTRVDDVWACCRAHAREGHEWIRIAPATLEDVMRVEPTEESRQH
jgi:hypothetical protein